jgi:hypothetical protein
VSPDCRCGHPAGQHAGGTYGCRFCERGCNRYEPDIAAVALVLARDADADEFLAKVIDQEAADNAERQGEHSDCLRQMAKLTGRVVEARKERDEARAALDAARSSYHAVGRDLDAARATAAYARAAAGADAPDVVHAYDALYCTTCYSRFLDDTEAAAAHHHPLIPVRVTVAHR